MKFETENKEKWRLAGGEPHHRSVKQEILSASASGPMFGGLSEDELKKIFFPQEKDEGDLVQVTSLTSETLNFSETVDNDQIDTNCQRPEAARAAALAAAEEAKANAIRETAR